MSWDSEWRALCGRIDAVVLASQVPIGEDAYGLVKRFIIPDAKQIIAQASDFANRYKTRAPTLSTALARYVEKVPALDQDVGHAENRAALAAGLLSCLRGELGQLLADTESALRDRTELAFVHLQRSLIVDDLFRDRWQAAFEDREEACERLGAVHLLAHGIWAFKAAAAGFETDLILQEGLAGVLGDAERAGACLVLTEWKRSTGRKTPEEAVREAHGQLDHYKRVSLAALELRSTRYVVVVSEQQVMLGADHEADGILCRHVNIAVAPASPSEAARRRPV